MATLSNIGAALFLIAFILLILCIISFLGKMEKQHSMVVLLLFFYDFDYIDGNWLNKFRTSSHRIFTILSFILFIFFLVLAILSVIKKTGVAKTIYYHCYFICYFWCVIKYFKSYF